MNIDTVDGPLVPNVWSIRWTNSDAAVRLETKKNNSCTKQMLWQGIKDWSRIGNSVYPSNESTYDRLFCFSGSHWVYASSGLSNCSSHWETPWNWWPSEISGYLHVHCHYHSSPLILWQSNMVWWKFHGKSPIDDVPIWGEVSINEGYPKMDGLQWKHPM